MKIILFFLSLLTTLGSFSQEMEDDLFQSWNSSSFKVFMTTEYKKMIVTTNRTVKGVSYTELVSTYKRAKFNLNKINFGINYTEHYVVENRIKSHGKYVFNDSGRVVSYERTDIGPKNKMLGTIYDYYGYEHNVLLYDKIRFKEYVNAGAVEMDTIVSFDSLMYSVRSDGDTINQRDLLSKNTFTTYVVNGGKLRVKNNFISGYSEKLSYSYDSMGQLIMIVYDLKSDGGDKAKNVLKIYYTKENLLLRTEFYDKTNALIEEKVFTYK